MYEELNRPERRSIRLATFDYSQPGSYFITICAFCKKCLFGTVENGGVRLSGIGEVARRCWMDIPNHFPNIKIDAFVVMPNHMHGIVIIQERARRAVPLPVTLEAFQKPVAGSIPTIVRSYKAGVSKLVRDATGNREFRVWQSNYFERVLRDGEEFNNAFRYVRENPSMWHLDKENPTP